MTWLPSVCLLEDVSQAFLEAVAEEKPHVKPYFSKTIRDLEVVEGSAARFDCKIEGEFVARPGWVLGAPPCALGQVSSSLQAGTVGTASSEENWVRRS